MSLNKAIALMVGRGTARRHNPELVTGIVTYDLCQAVKMRWQLQEMGLNCPKDVSIISAEDIHYLRRSWDVSGITCNRYQMGSSAAQMMLDKIGQEGRPQPSQTFKGVLIPGTTVGPAPRLGLH